MNLRTRSKTYGGTRSKFKFNFLFIPEPLKYSAAEAGESSPAGMLGSTFDVNSLKAVSLARD